MTPAMSPAPSRTEVASASLWSSDCPFLSARAAPYAQRSRTSTTSAAHGLPSKSRLYGSYPAGTQGLHGGSHRCVSITLVWCRILLNFRRIVSASRPAVKPPAAGQGRPQGCGLVSPLFYASAGAPMSKTWVRMVASTSGSRPRLDHLPMRTWAASAKALPEMPRLRESL